MIKSCAWVAKHRRTRLPGATEAPDSALIATTPAALHHGGPLRQSHPQRREAGRAAGGAPVRCRWLRHLIAPQGVRYFSANDPQQT